MPPRRRRETWADYGRKAAEAADAATKTWGLEGKDGESVHCDFLGPVAAEETKARGDLENMDAPAAEAVVPMDHSGKVRFRWRLTLPGAPPSFPQETTVEVHWNPPPFTGVSAR